MAEIEWTVASHLEGKPRIVVELYEQFARHVGACGPHEIAVSKTAIVFKGPVRGFAGVTPRQSRLSGFLDLERVVDRPPITRVSDYTAKLWIHRFVLTEATDIDADFVQLIGEAYQVGCGSHRQ